MSLLFGALSVYEDVKKYVFHFQIIFDFSFVLLKAQNSPELWISSKLLTVILSLLHLLHSAPHSYPDAYTRLSHHIEDTVQIIHSVGHLHKVN